MYNESRKKYRKKYNKRYTDDEIDLILSHEMTDTELSELLGRSVMGIQVMRSKIKKVGERCG